MNGMGESQKAIAQGSGRGGKLLNGSRDDSFLPTVEPPGEEGDDWLELCPESEFAACWQVVSVSF